MINYLSEIINLQELPFQPIVSLVQSKAINTDKLLAIIEEKLSLENIKNVIKIISNLDINVKQLEAFKESKFKEQLIIGYLGSKKDLKNFELFMGIVLDESRDEQLRLESSSALGALSSLNIPQYLPVIIN